MTTSSILFQALFERHGASIDLATAGLQHLRYNTAGAVRAAVARGVFPVPVRRRGVRLLVSTSDLAAFLSGEAVSVAAPVPRPAPQPGRKRGRPRKVAPAVQVEEVNHAA